jgi:16S rRNA G966 N2-methylase RsmD
MAKTNLTDEEKKLIIEALNNNTEPSPELMTKLFPGLAEKFDVAKLDRAKIATLEYAGKRSEAAILNQASPTDAGSPLQVERCFKGGSLTGETQLDLFKKAKEDAGEHWENLIVQGDNLQFLKTCYQNADPLIKDKVKGKMKLIYIDPPFATRSDFVSKEGEDSYSDRLNRAEFIETLRERLIYLRDLMTYDGAIYLHLDSKMHHYMRLVMDEIFGKENFRNEIYVRRIKKNIKERDQVPRLNDAIDVILFYARSALHLIKPAAKYAPKPERWHAFDAPEYRKGMDYKLFGIKPEINRHWMWDKKKAQIAIGERRLRPNKNTGKPEYLIESTDYDLRDSLWDDITASAFTTGYPTEKKEELVEQIMGQSSKRDDLVMDVFAGSGTTAAVAEKLGRRWIVCDFGKHAIYTMQKRMLRIGESKALGNEVKNNKKYGNLPKPFCVVSTGAYDFSRIMKLRENKDAYIDFVLGLFQLSRDEKDLSGKYRLTNIFGEKDSDPVEVYPVWDDECLKNIRIDEDYLKGIILQSGGRLKGNYYIITPETCALIGDTLMKNSAGEEVHFKLLKFPYKILEDVSRSFQIHEQPSSQENVNDLINSTGFYFNDSVEIAVEKTKEGLKITRFETRVLDKHGERLKGLDGLAMLLVDVDYNGEIFDMDRTVFASDIGKNREIKLAGLTESVAVIAIDKHGNESKPFIIKD